MDAVGRHITDLDLCDIVNDNALFVHASWTSLIDPQVTTRDQLEDLIYTRGFHLEQKLNEAQNERTGPAAFTSAGEAIKEIRSLRE